MAYNEFLAKRIQMNLELFPEDFTEKRMFGGLVFLYKGKMTVGVLKDDLMVRVISDKMESCLNLLFACSNPNSIHCSNPSSVL